MTPNTKAHLALFSVALIYGANYTIAKEVMNNGYIQPLGFILMRAACASTLFWFFHMSFIREKVAPADFGLLFICGLFGVAINQMLFFSGLKLTSPINASLMITTIPIAVILFAPFVTGEQITKRKILGIAIGAAGAVLLVTHGKDVQFSVAGLKGDLMILGNSISYGLYIVLVKKLMLKYHPITVVKWVFTFGLLIIIPFGWKEAMQVNWASFPIPIWMAFFYVLFFTTFLAYLFNAFALKTVDSTVVGMYVYLQPLIAAIIALLLAKDVLSFPKIIAGCLIYVGVYLVSSTRSKKTT